MQDPPSGKSAGTMRCKNARQPKWVGGAQRTVGCLPLETLGRRRGAASNFLDIRQASTVAENRITRSSSRTRLVAKAAQARGLSDKCSHTRRPLSAIMQLRRSNASRELMLHGNTCWFQVVRGIFLWINRKRSIAKERQRGVAVRVCAAARAIRLSSITNRT